MRVVCDACARAHEIPDDRVPLYGARLRCAACGRLVEVPPREEARASQPTRFEAPLEHGAAPASAPALVDSTEARDRERTEELHVDAKRLAQMLITDIAYADSGRLDRARKERAVLRVYAQDIRKAWEFYQGRVGKHMAGDTGYFREAVETILAGRR